MNSEKSEMLQVRVGDRVSIRIKEKWQQATVTGILLYHALVTIDGDTDPMLFSWMDVHPPF